MLELHVKSYSIDTRTLKPGDIFVAIRGLQSDGHDFVAEAFSKGASQAIVRSDYPGQESNLIRVLDPLQELQDRAHRHLLSMPAKRVALTGSSGKTTTKEILATLCQACLSTEAVWLNEGNLNNHLGLPLSALKVEPHHKIAILEMGMNHFGEIACLAKIAKPQIGLITNMGSAHAGNMGGVEGVAKAKAELFEALEENDIGVVNADDPRCVREAERKLRAQVLTFGHSALADLRILDYQSPTFSYKGEIASAKLSLLGDHNVQNAAGALAVAVALGLDFKTAVQSLERLQPTRGRLAPLTLSTGSLLLDDTYNANSESMEAGISVLGSFHDRRRIAVLGDMGELGGVAAERHHAIGAACTQKGIDWIFACGEHAKHYGEGAFEAGFNMQHFVWAKDSVQIAEKLIDFVEPNDAIWIKGSRFMKMERVIERLLQINSVL